MDALSLKTPKSVCRTLVHVTAVYSSTHESLYMTVWCNPGALVYVQCSEEENTPSTPLGRSANYGNVTLDCNVVTSFLKLLMFSCFVVNNDFSFVHRHFNTLKNNRNLLHATMKFFPCVLTVDVPKSLWRKVQLKRHFLTNFPLDKIQSVL